MWLGILLFWEDIVQTVLTDSFTYCFLDPAVKPTLEEG